ncbi:MAG: hypothetical protein AB7G75_11370 [Candidatus Binatia bacterium]
MFSRVYLIAGALILSLYGWAGWTGKEFVTAARNLAPIDIRQSSGGSRWFASSGGSGYRGGK